MDQTAHQWQASVAGALCRASRWCSASSLLMTAIAAGIEGIAAALIIAIGSLQVFLAVRIEFDRRIFDLVAAAPQGWSGFDAAMQELGLMSAAKTGRAPAARAAGLLRLVCWHAGLLLAQLVLALVLVVPL
jgi:hypothetical protein